MSHVFFHCMYTRMSWLDVAKFPKTKLKTDVDIQESDVLLHFNPDKNEK